AAAAFVSALASAELLALERGEPITITTATQAHPLSLEDVAIVRRATGALVVKYDAGYVAAIDPAITPELRREGIARELVNRVQRLRKDLGFAVSDRVALDVSGAPELLEAVDDHRDWIAAEVLATEFHTLPLLDGFSATYHLDLDGIAADVTLTRIE
ncbi:MAG: DUF5915 domain-containing protein, partial [Gemmatimonadaceae bacterium]